jgi:hypothetical protein
MLDTETIRNFPLKSWIGKHTRIRSSEGPDNIYADCPFCGGYSTLACSKILKVFRCFRCYEGGHARDKWKGTSGLTKMFMLLEQCSYEEALVKLSSLSYTVGASPEPKRQEPPRAFWPKDSIQLAECSSSNPGRLMLRRRGVEHLVDHARYCGEGQYTDRVILPGHWFGIIKGYEAKAIYPVQKPKALYPKWFYTGENLYSTYNWDWSKPYAVITESIIDAETLGVNAIGLYGSVLKDAHIALLLELKRKGLSNLIWMLDADAAQKAFRMILTKTSAFFLNFYALLPNNEDPNSIGRTEAWNRVSNAQAIFTQDCLLHPPVS